MGNYYVVGGNKLNGEVKIDCAKNSILPIMAACIMIDGEVVLQNIPLYSDVVAMSNIIKNLGGSVSWQGENLVINCKSLNNNVVPNELASKVRASIFTLGPILSRMGSAKVSYPGGCNIGSRPIDIHLSGFKSFGVKIVDKNGYIYAHKEKDENDKTFQLSFPSVGATENLLMYASLGKGRYKIMNCAKEPEIVDLANFLNLCGAKIHGAGSEEIVVDGVDKLKSVCYKPIPDRIETGTFLIACAMCGGRVSLKNVEKRHNDALIERLFKCGCRFEFNREEILIDSSKRLTSCGEIETAVYPGFPTDLQSQITALACVADGYSLITENLFESRFNHVPELIKMGANIKIKNGVCVVQGKEKLYGADVSASDLRGGASLVLAALRAEGYSNISNISYIRRGYFKFEEKLARLGANIKIIEN